MNEPAQAAAVPTDSDALFAAVYARLKAMAGRVLDRSPGATLDTTTLVHELYLRVGARDRLRFGDTRQFFAYAARAMRHLLADRARDRLRLRAGGEWRRITLTGADERLALATGEQALALDAALVRLEQVDARAAQVVELRYFAGLTQEQIGEQIGCTRRTVDRDWRFARAFLKSELETTD